ncbi:hypothetical protein, partial [Pseudomonas aeruginosa]|uniref:hypothetical protein n=1 Tax=Pseudomonas aeruginosa TaxID=287 RepID=UPI001F4AEF00
QSNFANGMERPLLFQQNRPKADVRYRQQTTARGHQLLHAPGWIKTCNFARRGLQEMAGGSCA